MLRGINQQLIFEDDEDNEKFLDTLMLCKKMSGFELYGYCLMGNHIHILLKTVDEDLDLIFKRIGARYVYWFNWKYRRSGHLFQDRFRSETVSDDRYLLTVLRYIHRNPIMSGLCKNPCGYKWSSYKDYLNDSREQGIVDTDLVIKMIGKDEFFKYSNTSNNDSCLECVKDRKLLTDDDAKAIMMDFCKCDTIEAFQSISPAIRDTYLRKLNLSGISIRQLNRVTGISKGVIERILRN